MVELFEVMSNRTCFYIFWPSGPLKKKSHSLELYASTDICKDLCCNDCGGYF